MNLQVNEIFASIQGEGRWTGLPCIFLRLQGCNLKPPCPWCDTPGALLNEDEWHAHGAMGIQEVLEDISNHAPRTVVVTGGEPTIQLDAIKELIALDERNHNWHLETNGTILIPQGLFDWVTVSPKHRVEYPSVIHGITAAHEIKIVITKYADIAVALDYYRNRINYQLLQHIWLQPVDNDPDMVKFCIQWLQQQSNPDNMLGLSVQTHKLLGVK